MRLSSIEGDPGYAEWLRLMQSNADIEVFFNGVKKTWCCIADTDTGEYQGAIENSAGKLQIDANNPDEVLKEKLKGDVRIFINGEEVK